MALYDIMKMLNCTDIQAQQFEKYYKILTERNAQMNLTAITDEADVAYKHFADCILPLNMPEIEHIFKKDGIKLIDIGSGAGFPGLPVKICRPEWEVVLADSLNKRVAFLNEVIGELELNNIKAVHSRAEDLAKNNEYRENFDVCMSRAVANMSTLAELCLPFVNVGGYFVSLKGPKADEEAELAKNAIKILGGHLEGIYDYKIEGTDLNHKAVVVKKISQTSSKYPRKAPKPSKEPL